MIVNGYITRAQLLREIMSADDSAAPNAVDDEVLDDIITDASRAVDNQTRRQFYAATDTLYLNAPVPYERRIWFDRDVLAVQGASDGNGNLIPATEYYLWPRNALCYAAIVMNANSQYGWFAGSNGNTENAITIAASTGFVNRAASAASDPTDGLTAIAASRRACLIIAADMYRKRFGQGVQSVKVTASGIVLTPQGIPADAVQILDSYVKRLY
jgi:hypothetical protein